MKRWLILLFVAILIGFSGIVLHQNSLEALGLVIALLAVAMLIWSAVRLSMQIRPPRTRRRLRSISIPRIRRRSRAGRSYTEELHAAIFQDQTVE